MRNGPRSVEGDLTELKCSRRVAWPKQLTDSGSIVNRLPTILVLAPALFAASSFAQTASETATGRQLAIRMCADCHRVTAQQAAPRGTAPSFAAIANLTSTTQMALHAFLSTPHANMPNLVLKPQEQNEVIAYILSLRNGE